MALERILVVDDEETIREIVSSMLSSAQYQTRQAGNGIEALALLDSGEEFDLVLSDLMMAEMDGIALLERTKERFPSMPVVMVTAVHDIQVALQAIRNGAYDYLMKPFEREQLLAIVRRALEKRRLQRENDAYRTNLEALVAARTQQWKTALANLEKSYDVTLEALGDALDAQRRRDRRPLQTRHRLHHRHCPKNGSAQGRDQRHCPRRVFARHRQDGDSRRDPAQARQAHA